MRTSLRFLIVVLALAGVVTPARAAAPLVARAEAQTGSWKSLEFTTDAREFSVKVWMERRPALEKNYVSVTLYREDDSLLQGLGLIARPGHYGMFLDAGEPQPGVKVRHEVRQRNDCAVIGCPVAAGTTITFNGPGVKTFYEGTFRVVYLMAGEPIDRWYWEIYGAGVTITAEDQGDDVFYRSSDEMDATLNAQVNPNPIYASVKAQVDLRTTETIEDNLYAFFGHNAAITYSEMYWSRDGSARTLCNRDTSPLPLWWNQCAWWDMTGSKHGTPGTYTFEATSVGDGAYYGDVILAGGDVRLARS